MSTKPGTIQFLSLDKCLPGTPCVCIDTGNRDIGACFDAFWFWWPGRKAQKALAKKAFAAAVAAGTDPAAICAATQRLSEDPNLPDKQMIPLPAKWLDAQGWDDEPYPPRSTSPPQTATPTPPRFDRATLTNPAATPPPANFRALAGIA